MQGLPRTIVAALDGSERSISAARIGADYARATQGKLYLFTAVRPPEGWWGIEGAPPPPRAVSDALVEAQEQILDSAMEQLVIDDIDHETGIEVGDPATIIMAYCEEVGADMLVIGRRGAGLIERFVMGSVADRIVHYAPCPVLVVP